MRTGQRIARTRRTVAPLLLLTLARRGLGRRGRSVRRPRVTVVRQRRAGECGLACLAMALGAQGRPTALAELLAEGQPPAAGLSAAELARRAGARGFQLAAYAVTRPEALADLPLPVIAHWAGGHWLMLERWTPWGVVVVDPGRGRQALPSEAFAMYFTGFVLMLAPEAARAGCPQTTARGARHTEGATP